MFSFSVYNNTGTGHQAFRIYRLYTDESSFALIFERSPSNSGIFMCDYGCLYTSINPIAASQDATSPTSPYEQGQPYGRGNTVISIHCVGFCIQQGVTEWGQLGITHRTTGSDMCYVRLTKIKWRKKSVRSGRSLICH